MLGRRLEAEIREQPSIWHRIADSDDAEALAASLSFPAVFIGSGSSYFVAQLAARTLRRHGLAAHAWAASDTESVAADRGGCVVVLSQSGRSADVLDALDRLAPGRLIAITNDADAPVNDGADLALTVPAGIEQAVPASKSVTAMVALTIQAAWQAATGSSAAAALHAVADEVAGWLPDAAARLAPAVAALAPRPNLVVAGGGDGIPVAGEIALKLKEAAYRRAEGVAAGEFRHGSTAMLDGSAALLALVGTSADRSVARLLADTAATGCIQLALGGPFEGRPQAGVDARGPFAALAWIVSGQLLALELGRRDGIDSDAPRGLRKVVV